MKKKNGENGKKPLNFGGDLNKSADAGLIDAPRLLRGNPPGTFRWIHTPLRNTVNVTEGDKVSPECSHVDKRLISCSEPDSVRRQHPWERQQRAKACNNAVTSAFTGSAPLTVNELYIS